MMTKDELMHQALMLRKHSQSYDVQIPKSQYSGLKKSEQHIDVDGQESVKIFIYEPAYLPSQGVILNLRGSGFMYPWTPSDFAFAKSLVFATNYTVVDVDYPVAPEHPFPAAVNAAFSVYVYLQKHFATFVALDIRSPFIVMGHSAGGNLAVTTQLQAKQQGIKLADKILLDFPVLDLDTDPSEKHYPNDQGIAIDESRLMNAFYLHDDTQKTQNNPLISPILASKNDLIGFPPTIIHTAEFDSLRDEAELFAQHLVSAYVRVTIERYPDSHHGFTVVNTDMGQKSFEDFVHDILS
ncbi:alpha/beta hydrolase [Leuconostoc gelidum subsp. aenigmaticum]|uniref:alpha/beta hydrolase n=1 Tax=Leuconostoc gelidum TaxID=1244 RepID=UPI001CC79A20|nr:alpha/beta hydrolase [Leuconostoc gelidum]MBZ6003791.1 alpha/beta hydrolase [Leuconostoc gelidum subsp. aenigmaticum]